MSKSALENNGGGGGNYNFNLLEGQPCGPLEHYKPPIVHMTFWKF